METMPVDEFKKITVKEKNIHQQIADYLKAVYPHVEFRTDFAAGLRMTIGQAVKHKKLQKSRAWPDITIFYPTISGHALFIELKRSYDEVYRKDGALKTDEHVQEQWAVIQKLRALGYCAIWGLGFDHTKEIIDNWLNRNRP